MKYCVNCRTKYSEEIGICRQCSSIKTIPNAQIANAILSQKYTFSEKCMQFGYPGEKTALILSILIAIIVITFLSTISFGLFFLLIAISLISLVLKHISLRNNNIIVSKTHFSRIYTLSKVAAYRLNIPLPEVYIYNYSDLQAYTIGFYKYGFIVISSEMANKFTNEELLYVIGHEMGHIKKFHTTYLNLIYPAQSNSVQNIIATITRWIFNIWHVKSEYTADQAGLIACQSLKSTITALLKLASGPHIKEEIDINNLEADNTQTSKWSNLFEYLNTHPFISNRIQQLKDFNKSIEYN